MRFLRQFGLFLVALLACVTPWQSLAALPRPADPLTILAYHEVAEPQQSLIPDLAVTPTNFVRQLDWLRNQGYHFVSLSQVIAAETGRHPLPRKPVLISFDDGYHSFTTQALPTLKLFKAPAVLALVGSWMEPDSGQIQWGDKQIPRSQLMSWDEVKAAIATGLVEVASHTYDLHRGVVGNPQGNSQPAVTTRQYRNGEYESEGSYSQRLRDDLVRNNELLQHHLGQAPRAIAWPYGRYNDQAAAIAGQVGLTVGLTLDDGANSDDLPIDRLRRTLMTADMTLAGFERELAVRQANALDNQRAAKIMHVDLDNIYDPNPEQIQRNLNLLLERIRAMGVNTVYLQAYADPDGNGAADALYFPNRHLPVRADLFNRVAWEIRTRTPVRRLYAWMPLLAFELPGSNPAAREVVVTEASNRSGVLNMGYPRLSPFSDLAVSTIRDIYEDLSRRATFDGLLFHDDVTLTDYEDGSPAALKTYRSWGLPGSLAAIRASDNLLGRWTILKINALDNLAQEMAAVVAHNQPGLRTARNLYAQVALNPRSEVWYSQSLDNSIRNYDFTAIMAMPYMEQARNPRQFLQALVNEVKQKPDGLEKVVFELQSKDWRQQQDLDSGELAGWIQDLYRMGARHVGYYPENPFRNTPDPKVIRPVLDSQSSQPLISSR